MLYLFNVEVRIVGTVYNVLKDIPGIGDPKSRFFCRSLGIPLNFKMEELSSSKFEELQSLTKYVYAGKDVKLNLRKFRNFHVRIQSYRGIRYLQHLPTRGQRTRSNAATSRRCNN